MPSYEARLRHAIATYIDTKPLSELMATKWLGVHDAVPNISEAMIIGLFVVTHFELLIPPSLLPTRIILDASATDGAAG
jgi:hypothetical protein